MRENLNCRGRETYSMETTIFAGLGLQQLLIIVLVIAAVGFILKKLFKLAITIGVIIAVVYYGLPLLKTVIAQ